MRYEIVKTNHSYRSFSALGAGAGVRRPGAAGPRRRPEGPSRRRRGPPRGPPEQPSQRPAAARARRGVLPPLRGLRRLRGARADDGPLRNATTPDMFVLDTEGASAD